MNKEKIIKMMDKIAMFLVAVGGLVHLAIGIGLSALIVNIPGLSIIQIIVGIATIYLIAKAFKIIK